MPRQLMPDFASAYRLDGESEPFDDGWDGWLTTVRRVCGLTASVIATSFGCDRSSVSRLEESERTGAISLNNLQRYAAALGCRVEYRLVPNDGRTFVGLANATLSEINQARRAMRKQRLVTPDETQALVTWPMQAKFGKVR